MIIIKRDGTRQEFDKGKIVAAVLKAFVAVDG
jgi:transcriptional regulator NrdR family protein